MKEVIHVGVHPIVIHSEDINEELDLDRITSIDYSNLYGEAVTVSALLNKVGIWKAIAEKSYNESIIKRDYIEAEQRSLLRRQAINNAGKFTVEREEIKLTERALDEAILLDKRVQKAKKDVLECKKDLDLLDSLFWAVQDKSKKLNNLIKQVTPEEFIKELIEGEINTFIIKKF